MSAPSWTYAEYWNTVIGIGRNAAQAIREAKLPPGDAVAIESWLCKAEDAAWNRSELEIESELPVEWDEHHRRALKALVGVREEWQ